MLDLFTGLRHKDINLDEEEKKKVRERVKALEDALQRRGVMKEFSRSYVPK